jgi:hypothetical protein
MVFSSACFRQRLERDKDLTRLQTIAVVYVDERQYDGAIRVDDVGRRYRQDPALVTVLVW